MAKLVLRPLLDDPGTIVNPADLYTFYRGYDWGYLRQALELGLLEIDTAGVWINGQEVITSSRTGLFIDCLPIDGDDSGLLGAIGQRWAECHATRLYGEGSGITGVIHDPIHDDLDMAGYEINNLAGPTLDDDAATKGYVDALVGGLGTSVLLQVATPGTQQVGHYNISGTGIVGALEIRDAVARIVGGGAGFRLYGVDDPTTPTQRWDLAWPEFNLEDLTNGGRARLSVADAENPNLLLSADLGGVDERHAELEVDFLSFRTVASVREARLSWDEPNNELDFHLCNFRFEPSRTVWVNDAQIKEGLLARVTAVDLNITTKTALFTVPAGRSAIVTKMVVLDANGAIATVLRMGFGYNANANDVSAPIRMDAITGSTKYAITDPDKGATVGVATNVFGVRCSVANGSARTATVEAYGVFI